MGLSSLWDSLTGARVREIAPQTQCSWLEKNRPQTSASSRSARKLAHLNLKPSSDSDFKSATSHERRKKKRTLSISRPRLLEESKKEQQISVVQGADIPDVPVIPPSLSPRSIYLSQDISRPRTAITSTSSMCTTERFELADNGLPSPTFTSPLPSPRSATSPRSPQPANSLRLNDEPIQNNGNSRKRSNSTASGKPKLKRASWFMSGRKSSVEVELPPPLPPPPGPLPQPPPLPFSTSGDLPDSKPSMQYSVEHDNVSENPTSPIVKTSLDGDSLLDAFPSVPTPIPPGESSRTLQTMQGSATTSEASPMSGPGANRLSPMQTPIPRPRPMASLDGMLAPEPPPKETPKHESKQLPPLPPEARAESEAPDIPTKSSSEDSMRISFSEELQEEYDRLMENMGQQPSPSAVISVMGEFNFSPESGYFPNIKKFSNDEALSKLEFGILK